jgi:signal transduction histidine kinase
MSWRIQSIRKRILLLVLVPVLSLFGLFLFTTSITGADALNLERARTLTAATSQPVGNFLGQLDTERVFALIYLSAPTPANLANLQAQEARTSHVTSALRAALTASSTVSNASAGERAATSTLLTSASILPSLHSSIAARTVSPSQALAAYGNLIEDSYLLLNQVILTETSAPIVAQALALERMGRSAELLQQENVLLVADLAGRHFPPADQQAFTELVGARRTLFGQTLPELDPAYRTLYRTDVSPAAYAALTALENTVIGNPRPGHLPAMNPAAWQRTVQGVSTGFERAGAQGAAALDQRAEREARATDLRLLLSGGLGLLAVLASIIVSLLVGRGLVGELSALRRSALELADDRLPQIVDQLSVGLDVDLAEDSLAIPVKSREIRQVRDALVKVQRTAVEAAVGQARLREGIGEVFRNLARRSQSLLHRQLALLDGMERRAEDPQELEDLFRIDHLTTRMRRHAESLIILSGQAPARGWRHPVPFVDVLRAAVAEVEDYTRVSVMSAGDAALEGPAVGDVIHMIAELIENATVFSPPNTPVAIHGDIVGQGYAVEIEDRGLGMSDEHLAEANDRLAHPVPFEPSNTGQLGLLVAGQLARRHEIRITLRRNPYQGTTAIVLIPHSTVAAEGFPPPEQAKALENSAPTTGRHSARDENGFAGINGALPDPAHQHPSPPAWSGADMPQVADAAADDAPTPGLPRRVRQASLVPELRDGSIPLGAPPAPTWPDTRSPEEARATMSAMQQGWERGRSVFDSAPTPVASAPFEPDPAADSGGPSEPS